MAPVLHVRELPASVRDALRRWFRQPDLRMIDADATPARYSLPWSRPYRLILAACGPDHCLIQYEQRPRARLHQLVVLGLNKDNAQLEWSGVTALRVEDVGDLKTVVLRLASSR
jgi:hypothetical protein